MIISAARTVMNKQGLHATTVRDIARAADVAVGTVTYHFTSITEVLAGVLEAEMTDFSADVMQAAADAPTGLEGLRVLTNGLLATGERGAEHWRLWLDFWTLAAHNAHYAEWQTKVVYGNLHGLAEKLLRRGLDDGTLPAATNPAPQSVSYIAMMDGLVVHTYVSGARLDADQARAMLQDFVTDTFT
jgi:AcrR family transcriptional regulator